MSQENVEVVRGIYDAVARRDDVTPFEVYAADIVWDLSNARRALLVEKPVYHGHEGVRQFWREGLSVFGEIDLEVEELVDAGDKVLAVIREREIGRASGAPVDTTHLAVWTLADGKVTRMQFFDDRQQALQAAGLSERGMSQAGVEIVRGHIEAFRQGDPPGALSYLDPHVVWDPSRAGGIDVPVAYGHEEVIQMTRRYIGAFEDYDYQARLTDLGSGAVLALVTEEGRGKGSGVPMRRTFAALYTVIDGKIARVTFFPSEAQALEAAGLRE